jgi:ribosomal protein L32
MKLISLEHIIQLSNSAGPNVAAISAIGWKNSAPPAVPQNFDPFGLGDGFLWAVPKHRRTAERRLKRKFGSPGNWKIILPRNDLTVCKTCGDNHEIGVLCGNNCHAASHMFILMKLAYFNRHLLQKSAK